MQNEFEKQVQQKMEELKLHPSEPVWQKVEMQIRKKKDRRRLIFWIPLFVLLLGGGMWVGVNQYSNKLSYNRVNNKKLNHQIQKHKSVPQSDQVLTEQIVAGPSEENLKTKSPVQFETENRSVTGIKIVEKSFNSPLQNTTAKQSTQKTISLEQNLIKEGEKRSSAEKNETVFTETQTEKPRRVAEQVNENKQTDQKSNPVSDIKVTPFDEKKDSVIEIEKEVETDVPKVDSVKIDSTSIKQPLAKKHSPSKWKLAFAVSAGISGSGKLDVFNGFLSENKSMDYAAAPNAGTGQSNGAIYYPPSEVKRGFSFAIKTGVKKQLTQRTSVSTALQYNYYSNSIQVGNRVAQSASFGNYSAAEYFSINRNIYSTIIWQSYQNRYHFLSLPLELDLQLLKKHPLSLSAGLSLQYLVQTNALIFDYNNQAYFHNKDAFNRMQLFSSMGLNYAFTVKKSLVAIGPELHYGISQLEKENSNHHLYMYGLKAQLQLK